MALLEHGSGAAWNVWINSTAWQGNGMGTACYVWIGLDSIHAELNSLFDSVFVCRTNHAFKFIWLWHVLYAHCPMLNSTQVPTENTSNDHDRHTSYLLLLSQHIPYIQNSTYGVNHTNGVTYYYTKADRKYWASWNYRPMPRNTAVDMWPISSVISHQNASHVIWPHYVIC